MQKKINNLLFGALAMVSASVIASCQVVTNTGTTTTAPHVELSELDRILQKYDQAGYEYEYSGEPVTITMSHWDAVGAAVEKAVVDAVLQGFNKRYPTITVELEIVQSYEEIYGNRLGAGTAHDVFLVPDGSISGWASSGKIMNLTPYIDASDLLDDLDDMYESCLTRYQYNPATGRMGNGNQLALPKDVGPQVMYYNKDWFEMMEVDLPPSDRIMTIPEAVEMWQALTKYSADGSKITGYGLAGMSIEGLVWSAGGDFLNPERTAFPTDPNTINGLKRGYQFKKDAVLNWKIEPPAAFVGANSASSLFAQQKVACVVSGRWDVATFRSLGFNWDVAHIPSFEVNPTKNCWSGSVGYGVNSKYEPGKPTADANKLEASWKLVEYIASKEGQEILTSTGFQIPVYESLALDPELVALEQSKGPASYEIFVEAAVHQNYGLWQYRNNTAWKTNGYDLPSEHLFSDDPTKEITVDEFIEIARVKVTENLG